MERHGCKLCSRTFANGRALGGHMKSHLKTCRATRKRPAHSPIESASSSSPENRGNGDKCTAYSLRENPRRSSRVADPEYSVMDPGFEVQEDRESETNSKIRGRGIMKGEDSWKESTEPASSVSDTSPEIDVAVCLMMLSRDASKRSKKICEESENPMRRRIGISRKLFGNTNNSAETRCGEGAFQCSICLKTFSSGQALGGHKRSHGAGRDSSAGSTTPSILVLDLNLPATFEEETKLEPCF